MRLDRSGLLIAISAIAVAAAIAARGDPVLVAVGVGVATGVGSAALWQLWLSMRDFRMAAAAYELPKAAKEGGAARFLRPEEEVVSFWPRPELDDLTHWVDWERHVSVQLVTGEGGTGKTRLARQLAREAQARAFRSWWVPSGGEQRAVRLAREAGKPALLIVDYAENRDGLAKLLDDAASMDHGPLVRVLLLSRSAGEWWQQLINATGADASDLLAAVTPITLGPVSDHASQPTVFREALTAFADKLDVACPSATPLALADPDAPVLVIHAAALLAVLDGDLPVDPEQSPPCSDNEVLSALLRHESRYWHRSQAVRSLGLDTVLQQRAVAAGCLVGAEDEDSAIALLGRFAEMADPSLRTRAARWLHDLYPPPPSIAGHKEWIGSIQPDRLAEQLVVTVLSQQPSLIAPLLTGLPEHRAVRALTVLARGARTDSDTIGILRVALTCDLENLAVSAVRVAAETNPTVGQLLQVAITSADPPRKLLERIASALTYPSVALADTAAVVHRRLAELARDDPARRAPHLLHLSEALAQIGQREEALAVVEQAIAIYQEMAVTHLVALGPGLAVSLNSRSHRLTDSDRREALTAIRHSVAKYRELAAARPDTFLPELAAALNDQAHRLADLGRQEDALVAIGQAVAVYRELAAARPDAFLPELAAALNNQAHRLADTDWREALAAIRQAVAVYRELAAARPDAFRPELAAALNNQAHRLADIGQREKALSAVDEAVAICRDLAAARPDAFLPDLATSLDNQAHRLADLGQFDLADLDRRPEDSLAAVDEAVAIRRALAAARPDAFLPDLAASLDNRAHRLVNLDRPRHALAGVDEAVAIYRQILAARPSARLPGLPSSLYLQASVLAAIGRNTEAAAVHEEADAAARREADWEDAWSHVIFLQQRAS